MLGLIPITVRCFVFSLLMLASGARLLAAEDICPAVACDCAALPEADWRKECLRAEAALKSSCAANNNQPKGFCALHGPSAKPLPLAAELTAVETTRDAAAIELLEQQLGTALWSLRDDLTSLQKFMEQNNFNSISQAARFFDTHTDEAFLLQQRIVASRQAAGDTNRAEAGANRYAKTVKTLAEDNIKLSDKIWNQAANSAGEPRRYQQTLAQRLLRISGKLYEQQAHVYVSIGDVSQAAKVWQEAARLDEHQVKLEAAGTNKAEYLTYYKLQASARWNRASYYWASAKSNTKARDAWLQAQQLESQASTEK